MAQILQDHLNVIQSAPAVSLSGAGGLVCEWGTGDFHVELSIDPDEGTEVYFRDAQTNTEWEGPVSRCPASYLDKWLWQASYTV